MQVLGASRTVKNSEKPGVSREGTAEQCDDLQNLSSEHFNF